MSSERDAWKGQVLETFRPLREAEGRRLEVRVVELYGERRLDVREYVESPGFTGFTRKGVWLSRGEFTALLHQRQHIMAALNGRPLPRRQPGARAPRHLAPATPDSPAVGPGEHGATEQGKTA